MVEMNSFAPSLPIEIIQLILSFLPKTELIHLLINPPNQDWLYATASVIYQKLVFTRYNQLAACYNLFEQTRKRRQQQQQLGLKKSDQYGFYSTINYSAFVRQIDLSLLGPNRQDVNDTLLIGLTMDCRHLCDLNLYNCYTVTTGAMIDILLQCPQLETLSLAGMTKVDVSCFLDARVLSSTCQQLRSLNLMMTFLFFSPSTTTFDKYKRQYKHKDIQQIPIFPKLQQLKLSTVHHERQHPRDDIDTFLFTLMILRCANIDTLFMYATFAPHIKICLHHCQHLRSITMERCHLYEGMFPSLLSQYSQQQRSQQQHSLERLDINHCFAATDRDISHKSNMDTIWTELMGADFHRLESLGLNNMVAPLNLLNQIVTQVSGHYLTRFHCPDSMTDDMLLTLMTRCPSLTHFSICMFWTLNNTVGYHYDRQKDKRTVLTLPVLMQAVTTWKDTLEWLEITKGRNAMDVYKQYQHGKKDNYLDDIDAQRPLSKKIEHSLKEQQLFIDYLCDWKGGTMATDKLQVLLLGGMGLPLSMDILERLAYCFPNTRYLAFVAKETAHSGRDLEQAMATWPKLDGFFCINQPALMDRHSDLWRDWKWAESKQDQFRWWQSMDYIS